MMMVTEYFNNYIAQDTYSQAQASHIDGHSDHHTDNAPCYPHIHSDKHSDRHMDGN